MSIELDYTMDEIREIQKRTGQSKTEIKKDRLKDLALLRIMAGIRIENDFRRRNDAIADVLEYLVNNAYGL